MKKISILVLIALGILVLAPLVQGQTASQHKAPLDTYPWHILPLAADAEILDVRENPANKGLEVMYVTDSDINTLRDYYESALKDAKDLDISEIADGYWITANIDGVGYMLMINKNATIFNPQYAGKASVYITLSGLKEMAESESPMPQKEGLAWPYPDLPGVPELKGTIEHILRADGSIYLDIKVVNAKTAQNYVKELAEATFSFDGQPDLDSDYIQFFAFRGESTMAFTYKGTESMVFIEYIK